MRILFLNDLHDPRIGSSIRLMYQMAEELRALGHEARVLTVTQDPAEAGDTEILGTQVTRLYSDYNVRFRSWVSLDNKRVRAGVRRVLDEFQPDVVHSHLLHSHLSYASLTQARQSGAAVVFTAHDVMTFCYQKLTCFHGGEAHRGELRDYTARLSKCIPCQRLRFRPGRNARIREVLNRDVDRLLVVSDELGRVLRANDVPVHGTVHNAIRLQDRLPTADEVDAFRRKVGVEDCRVIAIGGRLHEQKGVLQLFRMMKHLAPDFPDLRLLVMGKRDAYDAEFAHQARELGVEDLVVPTGWLDGNELQCAYAATDVFVTPSICFDTFGMVNLEAMEHSKPVVATCFGGSPEVVLDGETGYVGNPFDVPGFAGRIGALLADADLRRRMGAAGRARLEGGFTIGRLVEDYLGHYRAAREGTAKMAFRPGRGPGR